MEDAKLAVETGVDGVDVVIVSNPTVNHPGTRLMLAKGTSSFLMEHSHGKDMAYIKKTAIEVIEYVKSQGKEIRFSSEDSFRSNLVDLLTLYSAGELSCCKVMNTEANSWQWIKLVYTE